jgi:prevent-host-death family protein
MSIRGAKPVIVMTKFSKLSSMAEIVNVHVAKTQLSSLLDRVARGEEIIIAKAGRPVARLVPLVPVDRPLGFVQATIDASFFDPLPEEELAAWNESLA